MEKEMKKFNEMTHQEILAMSDEDYDNVSPFEKHSCYDCGYLKSALSWWCTNKEAIEYRGTSFPGVIRCHFWKPDWSVIDDKYKTPENGYVPPIQKVIKKSKTLFARIFSCQKN